MTKPNKPTASGAKKSAAAKAGTTSGTGASTKPAAAKSSAAAAARKAQSRKIVTKRQTPWGLIVTSIVVVVLAVGIVGYAVTRTKSSPGVDSSDPYRQPEIAAAKAISGVVYKVEPNHNHIASGSVSYDTTPPTGGNHSGIWADCTGTVYPNANPKENAVHMLEHGAVWITYRPGLPAADVATLSKLVKGVDRMAMSPYPGLKSAISLQSWGYQLFVDNASDPRITEFIAALRYNSKTTPEYGVSCSDDAFKANPSTFGHPYLTSVPAASAGATPAS